MFQCPSRGRHALPDETAADAAAAARRAAATRASSDRTVQPGNVHLLVAAALDDCAPCVAQARAASVSGRDPSGVVTLVTEWLSEAVAHAEAAGGRLPETAAAVVQDIRITRPTRLLAGLVPLAGPERPGGAARVTLPEVRRAMKLFPSADWPGIFDDALHQMAALQRNS
ncbi:hypothetical protein [Streptomyces sp. NPDC102360]|uniref:hypothetical protein n=1 Tax=Streptomyces sp. NPDC102360 TaxID=3366160 RepID=UPI003810ADFA